MADDDALHCRRAVAIVGIGLEHHGLRSAFQDLSTKGPEPGGVRLQPFIAEIAVLVVREHGFLSTTEPTPADKQLSTKVGREILGDGERHGVVVARLDQILHVVLRPAELGEDEGGGLVRA